MTSRKAISPMKRLRIFEAAHGICHLCDLPIKAGEKWEVEHPRALALLGDDDITNMRPAHIDCHDIKTKDDVGRIAKAKRQKAKHLGIKPKSRFQCSRDGKYKQKIGGGVVLRREGAT